MDRSDSYLDLQRQARERTMAAYADLATASADLSRSSLSTIELSVLIGVFVNDGFVDGLLVDHDLTQLLQAVAMWPARSLDDWEQLFVSVSATSEFQRYRLKRDIIVARTKFSDAMEAVVKAR